MARRWALIIVGCLLLASSAGLWIALFAGFFRRDTLKTIGHVAHVDSTRSHYKFILRTRVYEGRLEGLLEKGTKVVVYYNPDDPELNHASTDGQRPPASSDSGFAIPSVVATFLLAIGIGCLVAVRLFPAAKNKKNIPNS